MLCSFQNCGKGFESARLDKSSSAQCKAALKVEALEQKWTAKDFRCDDFASYECERRIFSPDLQTMSHSLKECLPGDQICVDVNIFQFDTSAARTPASDTADFSQGGSYNHEEIRCRHRWLYKGASVFEGDRSSLEESLSVAMSACESVMEAR